MRRARGFTMLELLIVIGVLGVVLALAGYNARATAERQREAGFVTAVKRAFWDGATRAASRGRELELRREAGRLVLYESGRPVRELVIPARVRLGLPEGAVATFKPSGKVVRHFGAGCSPYPSFTVATPGGERCLEVSVIGEVREVAR